MNGLPSCTDLTIFNRKSYLKPCILETEISDFHTFTARYYEAFDENNFNNDLKLKLDSTKNLYYSSFEDIFINILNTLAPTKTKILKVNNHEFMTKALRKALMVISRLKNVYLKIQDTNTWNN